MYVVQTRREFFPGLLALLLALPTSCRPAVDSTPPTSMPAAEPASTSQTIIVPAVDRVMPLCEYSGEIRRVVMHARGATLDSASGAIRDLLTSLDPATWVEIVCEGDATRGRLFARLRSWKLDQRPGLRLHSFPGEISQWARDRYIACAPAGWPIWLVPRIPRGQAAEPGRVSELDVPDAFAQLIGDLEVRHCGLFLEGGNVIAARDHVFVGVNAIEQNAPDQSPRQTLQALARILAAKSIIVGDERGRLPVGHLDLFMTAVGDREVLLGSPSVGREVMTRAENSSRDALPKRLGDAPPDFSEARAAQFTEVSAVLERQGQRVTRLPYADNRGGDFVVTYTNVLQETRNGRRIVYMPIYRIPALDVAARRVYEALGFIVREIDVSGVCHLLGMVRCLANVVERGDCQATPGRPVTIFPSTKSAP